MVGNYVQGTEATMNFVLQVDTMDTSVENIKNTDQPTLLLAQEVTGPLAVGATTTTTNTMVIRSDDVDNDRSQLLQCLETNDQPAEVTVTTLHSPVKSVVTYPVAKGAREVQKMIASSQTNTTQVLTTRVISQKLQPTCQAQITPVTLNISSHTTHLPTNTISLSSPNSTIVYSSQTQSGQSMIKNQSGIGEVAHTKQQQPIVASNVQTMLHHKFQPVSAQHIVSGATVKAITNVGTISNLQKIHVKAPNLIGQSQTVSLQKIKTVTNIANQPSSLQHNLSRIQSVPKSQVLTPVGQINQLTVNKTVTNPNSQKIQSNSATLQKAQSANATVVQKTPQVCNNQKISQQILSSNHPNHKIQYQQSVGNQQTQQSLQRLQGQKTMAMSKQQSTVSVNNIPKSSSSVSGIQKSQIVGQVQNQQQSQQKHIQQIQMPHQLSQSMATLQKSQTSVTPNRVQTVSSICKTNSVPNISKISQNSNVLTINKQQVASQQQQLHLQPTTHLQQQLLQVSQQQSIAQKLQPVNVNNLQTQRSITNVQQKIIAATPNNQRTLMNSKIQQQQQQQQPQQQQQQQQQQTVMRVGISKNQTQNSQSSGLKVGVSQKLVNPIKTANLQNTTIQQPTQRNSNSQPVKIIQQQQNVISPQNAQKQPGCIKTIPPQKPVQRNHAQKIGCIKSSLNTNVALKGQGQISPKTSIKTLLPQQTAAPTVMVHKSSPIKIQQQTIQQKQLIMSPQYAQQIRQQAGPIKTLLAIPNNESRKDIESKNETGCRTSKEEEETSPKSPVRRMPAPYECLQFVLQDHNYGAPPPRTPPPPSSPPPHPKQQAASGTSSSTSATQHPYIFGPAGNTNAEDDAASAISSEAGREAEPEGEETETAPEGEGDDEDSVTRCICDFEHDDGYMICCDRCVVWQHVDCMGIDRSNIPDEYLCERCRPRRVDRQRARALQMRKREELLNSDISSDTSSTSSVDTDVGATQKKRSITQQQVPIRKSDTSSQVRRLNNNNNVAKRQRRDLHPRQSSSVRKKEAAKRGPGKRKIKRRMVLEDKEEDGQDAWGSNMTPLRQWIERYEEAVTNHYSPELRARISSIKVNGTHNDLRQNNMNVIATGKCRLNIHSNNLRYLVATMYLPPNTPVVELRGKYMLSTQHRSSHPQGRQYAQRPGPFVFFYRLPRDGTEVCVDTRTYGNDARFVRRSCKPNAEVKHCIEKGTLHLYIVTTTSIEKNTEITIKHEQYDLLLSPNSSSSVLPFVCACNNPRECPTATTSSLNRRGNNCALAENADGRERRRRGRRNTTSEETEPVSTSPSTTSITQAIPTSTSISTVTTAPSRRTVTTGVTSTTTRQVSKEEQPSTTVQQSETLSNLSQLVTAETKKDKKKMTREERKMEAIMKAFERLEKAEQRKQEVLARNAQRKEFGGTHSDNEDSHSSQSKSKQSSSERPLRRKKRKGRARTTSVSQPQSSRRTRLNSGDSDVSSEDESNSMQSPPLSGQSRPSSRNVPYSPHLHTPAKNKSQSNSNNTGSSSHQGISTAAGLLLALANSNAPGSSSPPLQQPTPVKSPTCDSGASSSSQSSTPSTPVSSTCLLVAAAVGPLAPGFKFPKTKKVLMNEWLKESPDPPQTNISQMSPLPALPSVSLPNSINTLCRSSDFPLPTDPSAEFLSQSYAAKSLATLVQAANSVSGICDSPPQRRQIVTGNNVCPVSTGSAKKRWLRQAISEECDSPSSRPESPPLNETAPLKKRRIARESLSSDNYTPPTTPTMLLSEAAPNSRSLCTEDDYPEHAQSPIMEQNDDRHYESQRKKEQVTVDDDSDEAEKLQEKFSVDAPQSDFYMKCEEKSELPDITKMETSIIKTENITVKEENSPKCERNDIKSDYDFTALHPSNVFVKNDPRSVKTEISNLDNLDNSSTKKELFIKKEETLTKGMVEIIDQNEPDTEVDFNSSIATIESDTVLKQRVAEMQLEFGGRITEAVNIATENVKLDKEKKLEIVKSHETEVVSDNDVSIDEFDVEAQMKKITGDDGNDYREKIDTSSEKDKSMDGIEGLMESSKEDSDSEDKDIDDDVQHCETSFKSFNFNHGAVSFEESKVKSEPVVVTEDNTKNIDKNMNHESPPKTQQSSIFNTSSDASIFESTSSNMDTESITDRPNNFQSIPPLSERIRKKAEPAAAPRTPLDFEAAIIESTINMEAVDESKNGEQKSMLSTALRELLEAKLEDEPTEVIKNEIDNENNTSQVSQPKSDSSEHSLDVQDSILSQETRPENTPAKETETKPKEIKRLKDPRTVVPNNMSAPIFKPNIPVKRKLSISEYRKRKQQSSGTPPEPEPSNDASTADKSGARGRSDSASSGTSSLSSDEEGSKISLSLDIPALAALPLFTNAENDEKKGGEEGTIGWSAAPTLVERQRENLTERLKREFGLFLSDDEEERARKHGLTAEAILKARKVSPPPPLHSSVSITTQGYPQGLPQLPPQPYIPPPGSAPIHYPQFQTNSGPVPYSNFTISQTTSQQPVYSNTTPQTSVNQQVQPQFLVPQASQAPPGCNPYPPQFASPATIPAVQIPKFSAATPPTGQPQKAFFNHPSNQPRS